jgi:hypothetical protein
MATAEEVQGLYNSIIGRTGTPDEVAWWVAQNKPSSQMAIDFVNARNDAEQVAKAAEIVKSGASTVTNPTTWAGTTGLLGGATVPAKTTTQTAATTGGLLGSTSVNPTVTAADITNLYKNIVGATPEADGMNYWMARAAEGMDLATMAQKFRDAMNDPVQVAKRAALIKSGESRSISNLPPTGMPGGFSGFQAGIREVPFGATVVGGNVSGPGPGYTAAMYAPSIQDMFMKSMAYQANLPNMLPVFDPGATPSIYPQIAQTLGRYNIANATVPNWLRVTTPIPLSTAQTTSTGE